MLIESLLVLAATLSAYMLGRFHSTPHEDMQELIECERIKRLADGEFRRGDEHTEIAPSDDGCGRARVISKQEINNA